MISGTTQVTAPIAPTSLIDLYPTHDAAYGFDGLRNVDTLSDRNAIPMLRRRAGMLVGVLADNTYWRLRNITWDGTDNDWELFINAETTPGNVTVEATYNGTSLGYDHFVGVGTPTIVGYDQSIIYLVTFDSINTGPVKLLIDGLPEMEILKGDEILGLAPLEADDIQDNLIYYIVYDGIQLQLFTVNPVQVPSTYTNLNPATIAVGGIPAGSTFNNMTYKQLFDMMFYPYVLPVFNAFAITGQSQTLEVGASIATGNKTFTWNNTNPINIVLSSITIRNLTNNIVLDSDIKAIQSTGPLVIGRVYTIVTFVAGDNFLNCGASANTVGTRFTAGATTPTVWTNGSTLGYDDKTEVINFASAITKTTATSHTWRISATRSNSSTFYRDFAVSWYWRVFSGTSTNTTLTAVQIQALVNTGLQSAFAATVSYASGGYKYYCIPNSFGFPALFKDYATNLNIAMAGISEGYTTTNGNGLYYQLVSVTNAYGVTTSYRVYRSLNVLGGTIKIVIS